ncbi:TPA: hypothetical protein ACGJ7L_000937 [Pseudomonas aeruginosa]|uniref:DUF3742 family protein n=4 Tax=Pseudomonas aeruginosa TaxID=287 RepID=A0A2U2XNZ9_PSEAI|nr:MULTISPECIES: hypothetical protein [Pseudomonas]CDI94809.1 hypothetical protein BN889_06808 [Pseudomonas aeruginosa PA38182]AKE72078.1 hypothetical protein YQ19_28830 [Pseudomonas aeruginosa]ALY08288.1 hypothetical protein [Pseudomonas aeruginosa]ARG48894.1 hypothetical protein BFV99_06065 [Pseudomonas aeruginosa]AXO31143.1 hypothetical protein Ysp71_5224 [Pseudomonas aeruginosa]
MNAHTNKGIASRVGFGLGTLVRFCLHDRRPTVRCVKRVSLLVVLFVVLVQNFTWLASAFMTLLSFGLMSLVLVKGNLDISKDNSQISYGTGYGPEGYGYYRAGRRVDDDDDE